MYNVSFVLRHFSFEYETLKAMRKLQKLGKGRWSSKDDSYSQVDAGYYLQYIPCLSCIRNTPK